MKLSRGGSPVKCAIAHGCSIASCQIAIRKCGLQSGLATHSGICSKPPVAMFV